MVLKNIKPTSIAAALLLAAFLSNAAFGQCTFNGSITSADAIHANALATSGIDSTDTTIQACPGIFTTTGAIHYDKYDFSNQTGATQVYTVSPSATGCATFLMSSAYLGGYDPTNLCNAYLASMGSGFSDTATYSFSVPNGSNFSIIVEEFDPNAACASYSMTVSPCPSAAASFFSVGGRVTTPEGNGLRNARVILTDSAGVQRIATTSSFGIYSFSDVGGASYTVSVVSKRYRFAAQTLNVSASVSNVDFVGLE